jgi:hypothetical protein
MYENEIGYVWDLNVMKCMYVLFDLKCTMDGKWILDFGF